MRFTEVFEEQKDTFREKKHTWNIVPLKPTGTLTCTGSLRCTCASDKYSHLYAGGGTGRCESIISLIHIS